MNSLFPSQVFTFLPSLKTFKPPHANNIAPTVLSTRIARRSAAGAVIPSRPPSEQQQTTFVSSIETAQLEQPTPQKRTRRPMSEETKRKIAEKHKGRKHTEETRKKISEAMQDQPPRGIVHRLRISQSRQRFVQSAETRTKIAITVKATKQKLKRERLAVRAAKAAEAATADLRPLLDPFALEKAVIELTSLRRVLTSWMDAYERKYGRKPDLTEASETHPLVYGRFARYVALRELVRRSSLAIGSTPVSWT